MFGEDFDNVSYFGDVDNSFGWQIGYMCYVQDWCDVVFVVGFYIDVCQYDDVVIVLNIFKCFVQDSCWVVFVVGELFFICFDDVFWGFYQIFMVWVIIGLGEKGVDSCFCFFVGWMGFFLCSYVGIFRCYGVYCYGFFC